MATISRPEETKVNFTVVRNDANGEVEETKIHTFAGRATLDDVRAAVREWVGAKSYALGFTDEDSDNVVIATQDEWDECLRLNNEAANGVSVLVRVGDEAPADADEAAPMQGKGMHRHHHGKGKGKGAKRGRSCSERGTKTNTSDDEAHDTTGEPCKRFRPEHGCWKGGKGMRGGFDFAAMDDECPPFGFMCKGMKGKGKGCRGMKGCFKEDDVECPDMDMPCKGVKGMKGKGCHGMKGMFKGMKGMRKGMKGCFTEDDDECPDMDMPSKGMKGMKGKGCHGMKGMFKGMKGMRKGMKGCFDDDHGMPVESEGEVEKNDDEECPPFAWKGGKGALMMMMTMKGMRKSMEDCLDQDQGMPAEVEGEFHENDDEECPPFACKGGKGALMMMMAMKGKGCHGKGMKGMKGGKKGGKAHSDDEHDGFVRARAGKKGGKFGMHMKGMMKGGYRGHSVPMHGPAF